MLVRNPPLQVVKDCVVKADGLMALLALPLPVPMGSSFLGLCGIPAPRWMLLNMEKSHVSYSFGV